MNWTDSHGSNDKFPWADWRRLTSSGIAISQNVGSWKDYQEPTFPEDKGNKILRIFGSCIWTTLLYNTDYGDFHSCRCDNLKSYRCKS
jgi:hypothetical protein